MALDLSSFGAAPAGGVTAVDRAARLGASLSGTNLSRAGDYNQRVVLQAIRRNPGITRIEVAGMTGLTPPTIANITGRLFESDLILDAGRRQGGRGQPAVRLTINPDGAFSIGLNIDRDHLSLVSLDLAGAVRTRFARQVAFPMPDDVRAAVREGVEQVRASGAVAVDRLMGIGVALPDDLGRVALPHRPDGYEVWSGIDVEGLLADVAPWPVHVDNDAAAAAIGEAQFGGGREHASFFYILVSAGLGGGVVIDGAYYRGASARSGEIGFLPLHRDDPGGPVLQDVVSLSALAARLEAEGIDLGASDPTEGFPDGAGAVVERWVDEAARALVPALTGVNCLLNPSAILVGGRLPDRVLDALAATAQAMLAATAPGIPAHAPIRRATLSRDAPAIGAAILPFLDRILPSDAILMK